MGNKDVPIENPLTLSGGVNGAFEEFTANSEGGLSKSNRKSRAESSASPV